MVSDLTTLVPDRDTAIGVNQFATLCALITVVYGFSKIRQFYSDRRGEAAYHLRYMYHSYALFAGGAMVWLFTWVAVGLDDMVGGLLVLSDLNSALWIAASWRLLGRFKMTTGKSTEGLKVAAALFLASLALPLAPFVDKADFSMTLSVAAGTGIGFSLFYVFNNWLPLIASVVFSYSQINAYELLASEPPQSPAWVGMLTLAFAKVAFVNVATFYYGILPNQDWERIRWSECPVRWRESLSTIMTVSFLVVVVAPQAVGIYNLDEVDASVVFLAVMFLVISIVLTSILMLVRHSDYPPHALARKDKPFDVAPEPSAEDRLQNRSDAETDSIRGPMPIRSEPATGVSAEANDD